MRRRRGEGQLPILGDPTRRSRTSTDDHRSERPLTSSVFIIDPNKKSARRSHPAAPAATDEILRSSFAPATDSHSVATPATEGRDDVIIVPSLQDPSHQAEVSEGFKASSVPPHDSPAEQVSRVLPSAARALRECRSTPFHSSIVSASRADPHRPFVVSMSSHFWRGGAWTGDREKRRMVSRARPPATSGDLVERGSSGSLREAVRDEAEPRAASWRWREETPTMCAALRMPCDAIRALRKEEEPVSMTTRSAIPC